MLAAAAEASRRKTLVLDVRMNVEVSEEDDKGSGVAKQGIVHPLWKVAVNVKGMTAVNECSCKLQLEEGKI